MTKSTSEKATGTPLWHFSCAVYDAQGVKQACLRLQDEFGGDVNLVLFCCWLGAAGYGRIETRRLAEFMAYAAGWHERAIGPLRAIRRALKAAPHAVAIADANRTREKVLAAELDAERALQNLLFTRVEGLQATDAAPLQRSQDALFNIGAYLSLAGIPAASIAPELRTIVRAAIPDGEG